MRESLIQAGIRGVLNAPQARTRVWRNNVGKREIEGRWIVWGLAPGSGDLIGINQVVIRPEDVGSMIGQFMSVEVKTPKGRMSEEQKIWMATVRKFGGIAECWNDKALAERFLKEGYGS